MLLKHSASFFSTEQEMTSTEPIYPALFVGNTKLLYILCQNKFSNIYLLSL